MPIRRKAHAITRRECLVDLVKTVVLAPALLSNSKAAIGSSLPPLPALPESEALLLTPSARGFADYQPSYNRRTLLEPKLRALCRTPSAVSTLVRWLRSNRAPFAVRSGGHCFEGYSQSSSVVVDVRMMDGVDVDLANQTVTVGPGARLGAIYGDRRARLRSARGDLPDGRRCRTRSGRWLWPALPSVWPPLRQSQGLRDRRSRWQHHRRR